jgi:hypothetical protein
VAALAELLNEALVRPGAYTREQFYITSGEAAKVFGRYMGELQTYGSSVIAPFAQQLFSGSVSASPARARTHRPGPCPRRRWRRNGSKRRGISVTASVLIMHYRRRRWPAPVR